MPTTLILLFVVTSATSKQPQQEILAQVKDMPTCQTIALMLNTFTQDEPDLVFACKEVKAART